MARFIFFTTFIQKDLHIFRKISNFAAIFFDYGYNCIKYWGNTNAQNRK